LSDFPPDRQYDDVSKLCSWHEAVGHKLDSHAANLMPDSKSVERFVQHFSKSEPALRVFANSLVFSWADADDVVQSTAVVLWEKFDTFEEGTNFLAWACRIARYEVLMHRRREGRSPVRFSSEFVEAVASETVAGEQEFSDRDVALFECIDELPSRHRELMELRYREGVSVGTMAAKLGQSVDSLYKASSRVRKALIECVQHKLSRGPRE